MYKADPNYWRNRINRERGVSPESSPGAVERTASYEFVSRTNAPDAITFFKNNGNSWFANYTNLESGVVWDSKTMKLVFSDDIIIVSGQNLDPIQTALASRRVVFLREDVEPTPTSDEPHINKIKIINRRVFEETQRK